MKRFLLVLVFVITTQLINTLVSAQSYSPVWVNDIAGGGGSVASAVVADKGGNIYITGRFAGRAIFNLKQGGTQTLNSNGGADIFIAKYDPVVGNYIWAIGFGGNSDEHPTGMALDNSGNVIIIGQYQSSSINFNPKGNATLSPQGAEDVFFAKYDANGNYVWAKSIGESGTDRGTSVATDGNNNVFITGIFENTMNADPNGGNYPLVSNNGSYCQFFGKYDSTGKLVWAHALPGGLTASPGNPVKVDPISGNVIIAGDIINPFDFSYGKSNNGTITPTSQSNYLAEYSNDGTYKWAKYLRSETGMSKCVTILTTLGSNIILDASFSGTFYPDPTIASLTSKGTNDICLIQYTSTGSPVWVDQLGGNGASTYGNDICLDNNQNIIAAGSFSGSIDFGAGSPNSILTSQGGEYFYISKYDSNGKSVIQSAFGGTCGSNVIYRVVANSAGVYVAGGFCGIVDFDPSTCKTDNLTASAVPDAFVAKYIISSSTTAIGDTITTPTDSSFCVSSVPGIITGNTPAGGPYTYQWESSNDGTTFTIISGATGINYNTPILTNTTYYQRIVTSAACGLSKSNVIKITINQPPAPPSSIVTQTCTGSPATFTIANPQAGLTYNWYSAANRSNLLFTGTTYVSAPISANTTFYIEAANGACTSLTLATAQVIVEPLPAEPQVNNSIINTCSGSQLTLSIVNAQAGYTYNWYIAATGGTPVGTGLDFVTPVLTQTTAYYAEAVNVNGCISATRTPVNIALAPLPDISAQGAPDCPGSSAVLSGQSTDANTNINWYADATGGSVLFTGSSFTTPDLSANTTYYAEAVDKTTGCVSSTRAGATVNILTQLPAPVVTVENTTPTAITFQWMAVAGATAYKVSTDNGATFTDPGSGSNGLSTTISNLQEGQTIILIVEALSNYSCQTSNASVPVSAIAQYPQNDIIYVANAFTPNGDGKNDVVYVHGDGIQSMVFHIYDQFGELIFTSSTLTQGWDGTYKGTKQPVGVYAYYVQAMMYNGQKVNKKGTITLLR